MSEAKYHYKDGTILNKYDSTKILHRENGPAVEWDDGEKWWYFEDKKHRLDGPAVEYSDGRELWFINDDRLSEEEFNNHPLVIEHRFQKALEEEISSCRCYI